MMHHLRAGNMQGGSESVFDFVIVGGGTAGLVLANRLSEDQNVRVCVIEAGVSRLGDPNVDMPTSVGKMLNNPDYDWKLSSIPQKGACDRVFHLPRGKVLGGSSAINFMTYVRPCAQDLDAWASELGIKGWSFADLLPYFKRQQHLEVDQPNIMHRNLCDSALDLDAHGVDGPIHTSLATWHVPFEDSLLDTLGQTSGHPRPLDVHSGTHLGFFRSLLTIDRTNTPVRSYATSGYLAPVLGRPNLHVWTEALATRVILEKDSAGGTPVARGLEVQHKGTIRSIFATKEVILSAGAVASPQLLELSGIGDPAILQHAGIPCVVPSPHVGNNLQEKTMSAVVYELSPGEMSLDSLFLDPAGLGKEHYGRYVATGSGALSGVASLMGFVPFSSQVSATELEQALSTIKPHVLQQEEDGGGGDGDGDDAYQAQQQQVILHRLGNAQAASIQLLGSPANFDIAQGHADCSKLIHGPPGTKPCYALLASNMYPLSRGRVHVRSGNPHDQPAIDPGFLTHPADAHVLAAAVALADRVMRAEQLAGRVGRRVDPPAEEVDLQNAEAAREWVRERVVSYHHALGTCAMGRVVDERLRVVGVRGLRVVDASVLPMQVSAAILATVYAAAEKAADMIKEDHQMLSA